MNGMETPARPPVIEIWYDGDCPICRRSREWCERRDPDGRLRFRDSRGSDHELPVSAEQAEASMWVAELDGGLAEGFAGWRRILAELPGWRWLSWLTGVPPLNWLGPPVYRFVARHRRRLSHLVTRNP